MGLGIFAKAQMLAPGFQPPQGVNDTTIPSKALQIHQDASRRHRNALPGVGEIYAILLLPSETQPVQSYVSRTLPKVSSSIRAFTKARRVRLLTFRSFHFLPWDKTPLK